MFHREETDIVVLMEFGVVVASWGESNDREEGTRERSWADET